MLIAGPCAIESKKQAFKIAKFVKDNGATHFRGGAYKGQNNPKGEFNISESSWPILRRRLPTGSNTNTLLSSLSVI